MLTKENIEGLAQLGDDLLKFKGILEMLDKPALKIGLGALDNALLDKINEKYHEPINEAVACLLVKDYEGAMDKISAVLAEIIHTPLIDGTPEEEEAYSSILETIYNIISAIATKDEEGS